MRYRLYVVTMLTVAFLLDGVLVAQTPIVHQPKAAVGDGGTMVNFSLIPMPAHFVPYKCGDFLFGRQEKVSPFRDILLLAFIRGTQLSIKEDVLVESIEVNVWPRRMDPTTWVVRVEGDYPWWVMNMSVEDFRASKCLAKAPKIYHIWG